jgi:hypothetical protein
MPYVIPALIPVLQILCVVHAFKTGRDRMWIYILLFLPGIGMLAYGLVEILPGVVGSRRTRGLTRQAIRQFDPGRDLRQRYAALEEADTVDNRRLLAEELAAAGRNADAVEVYRGVLTGIHAEDPGMLLGMAKAAHGAGFYDEALRTILALGESNPRYHPVVAQLLYARILEALGRDDDAANEYAALVTHAPGEEVRCRYALLLQRRGDWAGAKALFDEVLRRTRRAPGHYRREQGDWIDLARRAGGP